MGGAFDPAAIALYDDQRRSTGIKPGMIEQATPSGMETVQLNSENRTVRFNSPDTRIDLGGFGKGYALEKIKEYLEAVSLPSDFVRYVGCSVLAIGESPAGHGW